MPFGRETKGGTERLQAATGRWLLTEYTAADAVITLESIDAEMPIQQLYRRVDWSLNE